jgi:hypothetical protein
VNLPQQCRLLLAQYGYQFVRITNAAEKVSQCVQSLIISAKPVGVGAVSQRLIPTDKQSGLQTHIAATARRLRIQVSGRTVWIDQTLLQKG